LNFEVFESDDVELAQADSRAEPSQEPSWVSRQHQSQVVHNQWYSHENRAKSRARDNTKIKSTESRADPRAELGAETTPNPKSDTAKSIRAKSWVKSRAKTTEPKITTAEPQH
jgi:hypothetical protein